MTMTMAGILINMEDTLNEGSEIIKEQDRVRVMAWANNHLEHGISCGMKYFDNKWHIMLDPRLPKLNINCFGPKDFDELTAEDIIPNEVGFCYYGYDKSYNNSNKVISVLVYCFITIRTDDPNPEACWITTARPKFFNGQKINCGDYELNFV